MSLPFSTSVAQSRLPPFLLISLVGIGLGSASSLLADASVFAAIALPLALLSVWLMHYLVRIFAIRRLTIPGFWYWSYLIMIFIPSFFIAAGKPDDMAKSNYLFAIESVLFTAPLGILAANVMLRFRTVEIKNYFAAPKKSSSRDNQWVLVYLIFLLGALGLTAFNVVEVGTIPLFYALSNIGKSTEAAILREASFKLLNSQWTYTYYMLRQLVYPFLILLALGRYLTARRSVWLLLFVTALGSGGLYAAFSLAKSPVAAIFLVLFFFLYLLFAGKISAKWLILGGILIFAFPVGVILLLYPTSDLVTALQLVAIRLLDDPARQLYSYFEVVPQQLGYLHGATINIVANWMGQETFDLTNYVALYDNPTLIERGLGSASANAAFIGDLHANFGIGGILAGGFLAGFLMQLTQIFLLRQPKTITNLAIYAYLIFAFWQLQLISLQTTLVSGGVIFVFPFAWAMRGLSAFLSGVAHKPARVNT